MKKRLKEVTALREAETKEYVMNGVRIVKNAEINRLQLFYDSKPDEKTAKN